MAEKKTVEKTVKTVKSEKSSETKPAKKPQAKKPNKVVKYFKDLKSEFKKVTWPSKKTVVNNTGVVLATMVICGLAIWGLDSAYAALLQKLFSMLGQ